jgi:hypothetical protein
LVLQLRNLGGSGEAHPSGLAYKKYKYTKYEYIEVHLSPENHITMNHQVGHPVLVNGSSAAPFNNCI